MATFEELGLSENVLGAVKTLGYTVPTPVQEQTIPLLLEGRDVIAAAQTGTGKTAAFALPTMDNLRHRKGKQAGPFMLVVTPTRELADQIYKTTAVIGKHTHHFIGVFVGGVSYESQMRTLTRGIDVCVATPGRLIDLMDRKAISLNDVDVLVIDEADRMLDMGFWPQVEMIVKAVPNRSQTMLFSATIDRSQDETMFSMLTDPAIVEISQRGETAELVDQYVVHTTRRQKPELLNTVVKKKQGMRVIVFTKTKGCADNCCRRLQRVGIPTEAIHADRSQSQRSRALEGFRKGRVNVLVATDVLARGIDVTGVDYIVNYDLPIMPEDYVHRIGRTGRAGQSGVAISFVTPDTKNLLRGIQKFIGHDIETWQIDPAPDAFEAIGEDDPRFSSAANRTAEELSAQGKRKSRDLGEKKGTSKPEKGPKTRPSRQRDVQRSEEFKRRKEAEAAGVEYVPLPAPAEPEGPRKPTLAERQAAAEEAFNALFELPNIEGGAKGKKDASADGKGKDKKKAKAGRDEREAKRGEQDAQRARGDERARGAKRGAAFENAPKKEAKKAAAKRVKTAPSGEHFYDDYKKGRKKRHDVMTERDEREYDRNMRDHRGGKRPGCNDEGFERKGKGKAQGRDFDRKGKGASKFEGGKKAKGFAGKPERDGKKGFASSEGYKTSKKSAAGKKAAKAERGSAKDFRPGRSRYAEPAASGPKARYGKGKGGKR